MNYHELLKYAIDKSGLSHREIVRKCAEEGLDISQSYLSLLSRGDASPASDKINGILGKVLSTITDINPDDLIIASYRHKIPADVLAKLHEK